MFELAHLTRRLGALALAAGTLVSASAAQAAVPATATLEGVLTSAGGGPAADGQYQITFAIYAQQTGGNSVWSESGTVSAKAGQFTWQLGSKQPLSAAGLDMTTAWLGLQIGSDPELPRQPAGASLFTLRAAVAENVACTGCIKAGALDPAVLQAYAKSADLGSYAKTSDLSGYAKLADLGNYAKATELANYVKAASLATVAGSGSYNDLKDKPQISDAGKTGAYGDLTGKPVLAKIGAACGSGMVLIGFKADGSLDCGPGAVAPDNIDEISNGLIFNQFVDTTKGPDKTPIPDGNGAGISTSLDFPDIGLAQAIWIDVDVFTSDLSAMTIELYGPGMANPYILYAKSKTGNTLKAAFNKDTAIAQGDMNKDWIGKNPKGTWSLTVKDPLKNQMPPATTDGYFSWGVSIQTLSTKKIQIKGNLIVDGNLTIGGESGSISGPVKFKDHVIFENSWCPDPSSTEQSLVLGGVCVARVSAHQNWPNGIDFCNSVKADLCSSAQSYVIRRHGGLHNYTAWGNWTNSYADNDGGEWHESVGSIGDDHGTGTGAQVPCCYNVTPPRATDQIVKINSTDVGIRVVYIHNTPDKNFGYAATMCASMNADLCSRSDYVVLRTAGKMANNFLWSNSGDDTDSQSDYTAGNTIPDNANYAAHNGAFACCAIGGDRTTKACPAGSTEVAGICVTKVNNSGTTWVNAARDCATKGGHICSVSQNKKLRDAGYITGSGTWSSNMEDCDGASSSCGNGSVGDNINPNSGFTYACCL